MRPSSERRIAAHAALSLGTELLPGGVGPLPSSKLPHGDVGLFRNVIGSLLIDAHSSAVNENFPLATRPSFVGAESPGTDAIPLAINRSSVNRSLFLRGMCLRIFHRRDSKTSTQTPSKRYLFVAAREEMAARTVRSSRFVRPA